MKTWVCRIDLEGYQNIERKVVTFTETVPEDCLALVSMSLMLYSTVGQTNESILLNNKEFSPCAIIGTFQSEEPSKYPTKEVNFQPSDYPGREDKVKELFYKGNSLMMRLPDFITKRAISFNKMIRAERINLNSLLQKRVSFKKG